MTSPSHSTPPHAGSARPRPARPTRRPRAAAAAIVAAVALVAFAPTLRFGLAYDDEEQIAANPSLHLVENIPRAFSENVWAFLGGQTNVYRPLQIVAYTLLYQIWGASPPPYHALNVLLHAANSALVTLLAARVLGALGPGIAAGLLFALHPVHAETVAWSAALPDLLVAFFALLAAELFARGSGRALAGSLLATAGGLFSKEVGLAIPGLLAACARRRPDARSDASPTPGPAARRLPRWAPHLALLPVYAAARFAALGGPAPLSDWAQGPGVTLLAILDRLGSDALRLLVPFGFSAFAPFRAPASLLEPRVLVGLTFAAASIAAARAAWRARAPLLVPLAWLLLPLVPSLYLPGLGRVVAADRYLYVPSVGFVLLAASALSFGALRLPRPAIAGRAVPRGAFAAALLLVVYAVSTAALLPPWRDSMALYGAVLERTPDSTPIRLRRAITFLRAGDLAAARADCRLAIAADSSYAEAWLNLGIIERGAERADAAGDAFERARALYTAQGRARGVADALTNQGELARARGDPAAAESLFSRAVAADSTHAVALNNLGALHAETLGRPDAALRELEAAARAAPWYAPAQENLATLYASQGRWDDAASALRAALRLSRSVVNLVRLGFVLERAGRPGEARSAYEEALRIDPANAVARARRDALVLHAPGSPGPRER